MLRKEDGIVVGEMPLIRGWTTDAADLNLNNKLCTAKEIVAEYYIWYSIWDVMYVLLNDISVIIDRDTQHVIKDKAKDNGGQEFQAWCGKMHLSSGWLDKNKDNCLPLSPRCPMLKTIVQRITVRTFFNHNSISQLNKQQRVSHS